MVLACQHSLSYFTWALLVATGAEMRLLFQKPLQEVQEAHLLSIATRMMHHTDMGMDSLGQEIDQRALHGLRVPS